MTLDCPNCGMDLSADVDAARRVMRKGLEQAAWDNTSPEGRTTFEDGARGIVCRGYSWWVPLRDLNERELLGCCSFKFVVDHEILALMRRRGVPMKAPEIQNEGEFGSLTPSSAQLSAALQRLRRAGAIKRSTRRPYWVLS